MSQQVNAVIRPQFCLNESPSEKEGKFVREVPEGADLEASMKAPPKRKGNPVLHQRGARRFHASMKAPPKRKGNHSPR